MTELCTCSVEAVPMERSGTTECLATIKSAIWCQAATATMCIVFTVFRCTYVITLCVALGGSISLAFALAHHTAKEHAVLPSHQVTALALAHAHETALALSVGLSSGGGSSGGADFVTD